MSKIDRQLVKAAKKGDEEKIVQLLSNGANVHYQTLLGQTAWGHAAREGHTAILKRLIEAGLDVDIKNRFGGSPLWIAAGYAHADTVHLLITKGASLNIQWALDKSTPLLKAVKEAVERGKERAYLQVVELLVRAGADIGANNSEGLSPVAAAKAAG